MPPPTYVIGHRNPDADSVCAAIGYAAYQAARSVHDHIPACAGHSNARIDAILGRFGVPPPVLLTDVTPRVRDVMVADVVTVSPDATCATALELIDQHDVRTLPVVDAERRPVGSVSVFQLGGFFVPKLKALRELRRVHTSLRQIVATLDARVVHLPEPDRHEELFVRVAAMDLCSFGQAAHNAGLSPAQSIIIVGDRGDIQLRAIALGVRLLVITGALPVADEVVARAAAADVALIVSPHDTANTAWLIRTATRLAPLIERTLFTAPADLRLSELRKKFAAHSAPACIVLDDSGRLAGIVTRTDVLKPVPTRLVLVDHNEMSQAVAGADQVTITAIIDHHRLGALSTSQPILFVNEPVGSTCTIIAELFRRDGHAPSPEIAGVLMGGIISDTLNLQGPTTTAKDASLLGWLSRLAGVDPKELADLIFGSGSIILSQPPEAVVRADYKLYEEADVRFAVAQIEELGFGNFWPRAQTLLAALESLRQQDALRFACLLVTDIQMQNSLLLFRGDPELVARIPYRDVENAEIFDLPGVVSRKKQLLPWLAELIGQMA
jgi:manganese-dependent inorganic pyrophosphatase